MVTPEIKRKLQYLSSFLKTLTTSTSIICLVVLVVYVGYNLKPHESQMLREILRACMVIFFVNILYHVCAFFRETLHDTKWIKWIVDAGIVIGICLWVSHDFLDIRYPLMNTLTHKSVFMFSALASYSIVELCYALSRIPGRRTNPSLLMASSFLVFIILGSFMLMLPRCTYHGISYIDSLFISASAVSITGLSSVDIPSTFTPLGLGILTILIQLGSLGIITFTSFFALYFTGSTSIYNQLLLRDVIYSKSMNALIPTLLYVLGFTLTIEIAGAVCVYFVVPDTLGLDTSNRLVFAGFHAMSSFCNAGFSCIPGGMSNTAFMQSDQNIYVVTSVLIFAGAVGFPILVNFREIVKCYLKRIWRRIFGIKNGEPIPLHIFDLNTQIVLYTTLLVLSAGSVAFLLLEYDNTLNGMSTYKKIVQSVFNSLIPRSAGFASVNPAMFLDTTLLIIILQMTIGGASQSMGGGIKVNTFGAIILNLKSVLYGHERATAFGRSINQASIRRANAVALISLLTLAAYTFALLLLEPKIGTKPLIFEAVSALFTVGSSLGVTSQLSIYSKALLATAMFLGRVGILSLLSGMLSHRNDLSPHYPTDNIIIN